MKKRNCRKTQDERKQHDVAIRIRKMTDAQIFELVGQVEDAKTASSPEQPQPSDPAETIADFINRLDALSGTGNGIGKSTVYKLRKVAEKEGLLNGV